MATPGTFTARDCSRLGLTLLILLFAGACTKARIGAQHERLAPTGIEPGETIGLVLKSYRGNDGSESADQASQEKIERCIRAGVSDAGPRLEFAKPGQQPTRYQVEVEVSTERTNSRTLGRTQVIATVILTEWTETTYFYGQVFDLVRERPVAHVRASASGDGGAGVGFAVIVPVPFGYGPGTESKACFSFGQELARTILAAPVEPPPGDPSDHVNCVSQGIRQWTNRKNCD